MKTLALLGCGRIGAVHAATLKEIDRVSLKWVYDSNRDSAEFFSKQYGSCVASSLEHILEDAQVDGVLITSPTATHPELVKKALLSGKGVFCEKPLALDLELAYQIKEVYSVHKMPFVMGFNRRFDPLFRGLKNRIRLGELGKVESIHIISRDPQPPPIEYIRLSGGLFKDMTIHDFDMLRFLLDGESFETIQVEAGALINPDLEKEEDIDSAMIVLRSQSGVLCSIHNSRRTSYGYDQRIEVFGEKGVIQCPNVRADQSVFWGAQGERKECPHFFFLERYKEAYKEILKHFISVLYEEESQCTLEDGILALELAESAHGIYKPGLYKKTLV
jgi:myo-inositol 2-dehydrogenase/D-chiro-inositol 1-dehydrogenase